MICVLPHTFTGSWRGDSIRHLLLSLGRCSYNLTGIGSGRVGWRGCGWFGVIRGAIRIKPIRASVGPLPLPEAPRQMGRLISRRNGTCHPDPSGHLPPPWTPSTPLRGVQEEMSGRQWRARVRRMGRWREGEGRSRVKCHGLLICFQLRCGTLQGVCQTRAWRGRWGMGGTMGGG